MTDRAFDRAFDWACRRSNAQTTTFRCIYGYDGCHGAGFNKACTGGYDEQKTAGGSKADVAVQNVWPNWL